jgi:hypothetical protein
MSNGTTISNTFFSVSRDGQSLRLPYFSSHLLDSRNDDIELAVIAFHGSGDPIAEEYLGRVQDAGHSRFQGGLSRNTSVRISFFTAIDRLLAHLVRSGNFPGLRRIVVVGHSAGGQFVNRYAASSELQCLGISFRYVVLNPSHYVYFSDERWIPGTSHDFEVPSTTTQNGITECRTDQDEFDGYNEYPYGLDDLWGYHDRHGVTPAMMSARYRHRDVVHLVGENDNDPSDPWLAKSCMAMLQGQHRRERGEVYSAHLAEVFGALANHHFDIVPGAGHNGRQMITSDVGRGYIFEEFNFPTMKTLADYIVVRDTSFALESGGDREFAILVPDDAVRSGSSKRPVLAFFADPSGDASNLRASVSVNGNEIVNYRYSGGTGRGHWEVFGHDGLRVGERNEIRFSVTSGTGTMNFSDIILWLQRNVC